MKGIRLPDSLWDAIDEDAAEAGQTRNAWFNARARGWLRRGERIRETGQNVRHADIVELPSE